MKLVSQIISLRTLALLIYIIAVLHDQTCNRELNKPQTATSVHTSFKVYRPLLTPQRVSAFYNVVFNKTS